MEVSGLLHAPAVLPPEKEPPVPIQQEVEYTPDPVWTTWRIEILDPTATRSPTPRSSSAIPAPRRLVE
jgi:hypothetical protein